MLILRGECKAEGLYLGLEPTLNGNPLPRNCFCGAQQGAELRWGFGGAALSLCRVWGGWRGFGGSSLWTLWVWFQLSGHFADEVLFCVLCRQPHQKLPAHSLGVLQAWGAPPSTAAGNKGFGTGTLSCTISPAWSFGDGSCFHFLQWQSKLSLTIA